MPDRAGMLREYECLAECLGVFNSELEKEIAYNERICEGNPHAVRLFRDLWWILYSCSKVIRDAADKAGRAIFDFDVHGEIREQEVKIIDRIHRLILVDPADSEEAKGIIVGIHEGVLNLRQICAARMKELQAAQEHA